jgi:hypothetical protein
VLPFGRPASDTASEAGRREKLVVMRYCQRKGDLYDFIQYSD